MLVEDIKNNTIKVYSVAELTNNIKNLLRGSFPSLYVSGEISNLKLSSSKHLFFSLKDDKAMISCVIFEFDLNKLKFKLENGLKIIAFGSVNVYEKSGSYNLIIKDLLPEGKGSLQLAFEQLKDKLEKEGLFRLEAKKPIPEYPQKIGIITALNGAALKDILKIINRRYSNVHIMIYPAIVQGENSAKTIVKGIQVFNRFFPVDIIIVGRGGGSIEDLWSFNEESVARAIYQSEIPIMSAVGHEIDYTISDLVADKRAPTPTAAAELVVKNKSDILQKIVFWQDKLNNFMDEIITTNKISLDLLFEKYNNVSKNILQSKLKQFELIYQQFFQSIITRITKERNRFNSLFENYKNCSSNRLIREKNRFQNIASKLALLNPFLILERGYSITYKYPEMKIIKDVNSVNENDVIKIKLFKGEIQGKVISIIKK